MSAPKMNTCLFCGGGNLHITCSGERYPTFAVRCKECDCRGPSGWQGPHKTAEQAVQEAVARWNDPISAPTKVDLALAEMARARA